MQIIPVLDLKGGQVVLARMGQRHLYEPIRTKLSASSEPVRVAQALLSLHDFETLYIADLDAIGGGAPNTASIEAIERHFPSLTIWVDAGIARAAALDVFLARHRAHAVIGSESQADTSLLASRAADARFILSLDYRGDEFQGPVAIGSDSSLWPLHVIVMTLARVGSTEGPDFARLADIMKIAPARRIHAAGGVRDIRDLRGLASMGIAGVLVASALHDGRLTQEHLKEFARP